MANVEHTVFGNGNPGLKTDVVILKREVSELGDIKARLTRMERGFWAVCGVIAFIEIYVKLIK